MAKLIGWHESLEFGGYSCLSRVSWCGSKTVDSATSQIVMLWFRSTSCLFLLGWYALCNRQEYNLLSLVSKRLVRSLYAPMKLECYDILFKPSYHLSSFSRLSYRPRFFSDSLFVKKKSDPLVPCRSSAIH